MIATLTNDSKIRGKLEIENSIDASLIYILQLYDNGSGETHFKS